MSIQRKKKPLTLKKPLTDQQRDLLERIKNQIDQPHKQISLLQATHKLTRNF